jgi:hypothetical protein
MIVYLYFKNKKKLKIVKKIMFFFLDVAKKGGKTISPPPSIFKSRVAIAPSSFALEVALVKFELQTQVFIKKLLMFS